MRARAPRAIPAIAAAALAALVLASAPLAPRAGAAPPPPDPIRISFGTIAPDGTPWAEQMTRIKRRIEKESNGRVKVACYFNGRRGSEREMLTELRHGKLQGAGLSNAIIATEVPELAVLELPFLFRNDAEVDFVIDEVVGKDLEAKIAEKGIFLNFWAENGWRSIGTRTRAVHAPADAKGLKVRAQETPINVELWKRLEATPTEIPLNEVLSALQTGLIEGFDQTPVYMSAAGWHTQIKYYTLTEHVYQPACLVYNKRFIESLPDDLRKIVIGDGRAESAENRRRVRAMAADVVKELEAAKIEVIRLSDAEKDAFRAKVAGLPADFKESVGPALLEKVQKALEARRAKERGAPPPKQGAGTDGRS